MTRPPKPPKSEPFIAQPMLNSIDPKNLSHHPLNAEIYGAATPDAEFLDSCRGGIIEHLHITKENVVISGNRRLAAALALGIEKVPVIIRYDLADSLDIEHALITANKYREKTNEQKAREYRELKRIEAERAKIRGESSQFTKDKNPSVKGKNQTRENPDPPFDGGGTGSTSVGNDYNDTISEKSENSEQESQGKARDLAASQVGWSGKTGEKALEVLEEIEDAEESGEEEVASDLRETLNAEGVKPAHKKAAERKAKSGGKSGEKRTRNREARPKTEFEKKLLQLRSPYNSMIKRIGDMTSEFAALKGQPGGEFVTEVMIADFKSRAENLQGVLQDVRPVACKSCGGDGCKVCEWRGYTREY